MTLHAPETKGAQVETGSLVGVIHHATTPQSGRPMVGVFLDALIAAYKLTQQDVHLNRDQFMHLVGMAKYWNQAVIAEPAISEFDPDTGTWISRWTGKQLFSEICPDIDYSQLAFFHDRLSQGVDAYFTFNNAAVALELDAAGWKARAEMTRDILCDRRVILLHGDLLCGRLDAPTLSNQANSFGHLILHKHGVVINAHFLSDVQRVGNEFLTGNGLSIGVMDSDIPISDQIQARVDKFVNFLNEHPDLEISDRNSPALNYAIEAKLCTLVSELRNHIGGLIRKFHNDPRNPVINRQQEIARPHSHNKARRIFCEWFLTLLSLLFCIFYFLCVQLFSRRSMREARQK